MKPRYKLEDLKKDMLVRLSTTWPVNQSGLGCNPIMEAWLGQVVTARNVYNRYFTIQEDDGTQAIGQEDDRWHWPIEVVEEIISEDIEFEPESEEKFMSLICGR